MLVKMEKLGRIAGIAVFLVAGFFFLSLAVKPGWINMKPHQLKQIRGRMESAKVSWGIDHYVVEYRFQGYRETFYTRELSQTDADKLVASEKPGTLFTLLVSRADFDPEYENYRRDPKNRVRIIYLKSKDTVYFSPEKDNESNLPVSIITSLFSLAFGFQQILSLRRWQKQQNLKLR